MNKQEVFDKVYAHLVEQGHQAKGHSSGGSVSPQYCAYRSADGVSQCAMGVLIDDEHYNVGMEGNQADDPLITQALRDSGVGCAHYNDPHEEEDDQFFVLLQDAHDSDENWDNGFVGHGDMESIAFKYELKFRSLFK